MMYLAYSGVGIVWNMQFPICRARKNKMIIPPEWESNTQLSRLGSDAVPQWPLNIQYILNNYNIFFVYFRWPIFCR